MTDIGKQKFVCLDCETTGLDPANDRIIEVAAICFDLTHEYGKIESLVNPERSIPEESIAIHHITHKMVSDKLPIKEILPEFLKFVGNNIIVGHGVGFDIEVLTKSAEREGIPVTLRENRFVDTLRLARIYGESPSNSLEQLRKHFQIDAEVAHRAMSDVIVNIDVFKRLINLYPTVERLFDVLSRPIMLKDMPLGKHKGRPFKEIPLQYLQWAANKDFDGDLLYSIKTELKRRKKGNLFYQEINPFKNL